MGDQGRAARRGDVPEDVGLAYEQQRRGLEALQRSAATLGEVLDRPLPQLPDSHVTRVTSAGGVTAVTAKVPASALPQHALCCAQLAAGVPHLSRAAFEIARPSMCMRQM